MCITYWGLIRKENALLYHARKQGNTRLGIYPVPPASVSEQKAKDAIRMTLFLESLAKSDFANLKWSLMETSHENFMAPPENTFKKRGAHVTVVYDENAMNSMVYTLWKEVFYVDEVDHWHKATSDVDYYGIYYTTHEGTRVYYVQFEDDAARYSNSGRWAVHFETKVLSPPVTSSLSAGSNGGHAQTGDNAESRYTRSPTKSSRNSRSGSRTRSVSRSRSRSPAKGSHPRGGETELQTSGRPPGRRRRGTPEPQRYSGGPSPPAPGEVGTRSRTPPRKTASRLAHLIESAYDPPVLLLQGAANTLKCFRRRVTHAHPHKFLCMSTSWTWVSKTSPLKSGNRMLIAFTNSDQRSCFLTSVRLPKGVRAVNGSLDGL
ncbi:E2 protein [Bos taurus papillomavirus 24]|nr:E2 protein [Bos taurus papillomavirus 24]